ncbi:hypothetical protein PILCRDRAFT_528967 [Piloderma croceum F 1598]|uniref:Extracellular membrane protein CFEM domain-containing protein n=1 Tax=Piloderma croceum (strain F 1598) TaxID=765440 RepID=A0A0C3B3B2_PILCF|nr:hypothetical protein PILCRDRAFT_528967 [Piloderma croceum F 1598]
MSKEMYKIFQVGFMISAFIVGTLADTSFCTCRSGGSPDNDETQACCGDLQNSFGGLKYSVTHSRCDCATEALFNYQSQWGACCAQFDQDSYDCEIG